MSRISTCIFVCVTAVGVVFPAFAQTQTPPAVCVFGRDLFLGVQSPEVLCLQKFLNASGFTVAQDGTGSPGRETDYYGSRTMRAVAQWQSLMGVAPTQGFFGPRSRAAYRVLTQKVVQAQTSIPPSVPRTTVSPSPRIVSITPDHITDGDVIVISGSGFTSDGNLVRYSIDPPGFVGRATSVGNVGSELNMRIDTTVRAKIQNQIGGLPQMAQREIKIHFAKSISAQYGISASEGIGYIPIDLTVRNKNGVSAPFTIYVNVIP
ncbi:MAG: peptidoglycan-binding protein [Candidatus Sungbacteria bacterium]|nr:peptidoglycan-binding protein [Candidatus Sungbacteria bacterium]